MKRIDIMAISSLQFTRPILKKCTFELNDHFDKTGDKISISSKVSINEADHDIQSRTCDVGVRLVVGENNEKAPFYIEVIMVSKFRWEKELDCKIDSMLKINAPALLISYIRPIITNLTANSRYPAYYLPFINFSDNQEEKNSKKLS